MNSRTDAGPLGRRKRGWWPWIAVVLAAGVITGATAPGQTTGLAVFTDPLIRQLGVSRTEISLSYLIGTLAGALAQPFVGRALDRWGVRGVTLIIGSSFAAVLLALSLVSEIVGLTAGFVGVRMLGQGALSLAATTAVARAITRRRGLALGLTGAVGSAGISLAPLALEPLIGIAGIDGAWRWEAAAVAVLVLPLALLLPGRPDRSVAPNTGQLAAIAASWTVGEAMRSAMFWVLVAGLVATGMLATALAFHQIAVLGEQGLSPFEAAANFVPQTATGILTTVLSGALVDRVESKLLIVFSMASLAAALLMLPLVEPGWSAIMYGFALGAAGGSIRGVEAASYAQYFGTAHIGSIRGVAMSITLASTAIGPLALSVGHDLTGDFVTPAAVSAAFPVAVGVTALFVRPPRRRPTRPNPPR